MKQIVGLLSLILCLATWLICPSAQASEPQETWELLTSSFQFQGGTVSYTDCQKEDEWILNYGLGERKLIEHVDFPESYYFIPTVVVYLTGIDEDNTVNNRLQIQPINITPEGFDIEYKTWWDSRINGLWSSWVAYSDQNAQLDKKRH